MSGSAWYSGDSDRCSRLLLANLGMLCFIIISLLIYSSTPYLLFGLIIISLLLTGLILLCSPPEVVGLFAIFILFGTLVSPFLLIPTIHGFDTWIYIGSALRIATEGWLPSNYVSSAHQFPGFQIFTVIISRVLDTDIVSTAKYVTPFLKIMPIFIIYLLARQVISPNRALVAPLSLTVTPYFISWMPYHHLTLGIILGMFAAYVYLVLIINELIGVLGWSRSRAFAIFLVAMSSVTITHHYSIVQLGILLLIPPIVFMGIKLVTDLTEWGGATDFPGGMKFIPIIGICGMVSLSYFFYLASEYLQFGIPIHLYRSRSSFVEPIPELVRVLDPISTSLGGSIPGFIINSGTLLMIGIMGIFTLIQLIRNKDLLSPLSVFTIILYGFAALYIFLRAITAFGLGMFGPSRRMLINAFPFGVGGMLATAEYNEQFVSTIRPLLIVAVGGWLVISMSLYPVSVLSDDPFEETNENYKQYVSEEEMQAYSFAGYGQTFVTARRGAYYIYAYRINVNPIQNIRIYAGNSSSIPNNTLVILRPWLKRSLATSGRVTRYRIPEDVYESYDYRSRWQRIYSAGDAIIYSV